MKSVITTIILLIFTFASKIKAETAQEHSAYVPLIIDMIDSISKIDERDLIDSEKSISLAASNICFSNFNEDRKNCLVTHAKNLCQRLSTKSCTVAMDVLITNRLNRGSFLTTFERYKALRDKKSSIRRAMKTKYSYFILDFRVSEHYRCTKANFSKSCFANSINQFCLSTAKSKNLTWSACVAALVYSVRSQSHKLPALSH